jgi:4'-phosphopantetheinyl transferase
VKFHREYLGEHILVWIARVSQSDDAPDLLEPCLDAKDRERAARFHFAADRARFVLGRRLLRTCLARYLARAPETIELAYTPRGRPVLANDEKLQFSISHTQNLVALAVTDGARIGIDLEAVQPHPDLPDLAERIFSATDLATFNALPASAKMAAFHRVWTRKEAYLKARGEGIAERLGQVSVSMGPEQIPTLHDGGNIFYGERWRLFLLPLPAGYAGALACDDGHRAIEGAYVRIRQGEPIPDTSLDFKFPIA